MLRAEGVIERDGDRGHKSRVTAVTERKNSRIDAEAINTHGVSDGTKEKNRLVDSGNPRCTRAAGSVFWRWRPKPEESGSSRHESLC